MTPGQGEHVAHNRRTSARPSKRTYVIRRIVALGLLVLVVVASVSVIRSVFADGDGGGGASTDPSVSSSPSSSSPSSGGGEPGTTSPVPDTTAPTESTGPRVPSSADPARVLLVGDSEAQGLAPFLETVLDADGLTTLSTDGRNSTGLVRDDFFDWPAHLNEIVPAQDPDIVVAFFGGNDGQPFQNMVGKPVDSPEWRAEYGRRVGAVMDFLAADGRTLIWIGVPNAGQASLSATLTVQNAVVNEQIAARPDVVFIDSWRLFSGIDGGYAPLVLDPLSGTYVAVQTSTDMFHLNTPGTKILASAVGQAIADDLIARGAPAAGDPTATTVDIDAPGTYTIVADDNLTAIAAKTGTTVEAIVAANGWQDANEVIQVGQDITMPAKAP